MARARVLKQPPATGTAPSIPLRPPTLRPITPLEEEVGGRMRRPRKPVPRRGPVPAIKGSRGRGRVKRPHRPLEEEVGGRNRGRSRRISRRISR